MNSPQISLTDIQISATYSLLEALQVSEKQMRRRINLLTEIVFELDLNGEIIFSNEAWKKKLGYAAVNGTHLSNYAHPFDLDTLQNELQTNGLKIGQVSNKLIRFKHRDGHILTMSSNFVRIETGIVGALHDITEQIQVQNDLTNLAHFDSLTKLPNRVLFEDRLRQAVIYAKRHRHQIAVIFLDLDDFKFINDTYGHHVGDEVLREFGRLVSSVLRETDSIARIGGDEFLILLPELESSTTREMLLQRIGNALCETIVIGGIELLVRVSMGISIYPDDDTDADQLIQHADLAMYSAKQSGKNQAKYFDSEKHFQTTSKFAYIEKIKNAYSENQFLLHYQPKVSLINNQIFGVEALIRWHHPDKGILSPGVFLPIIEGHPISLEIGRWSVRSAVQALSEWNASGVYLEMNVNIGGAQLHELSFYDFVVATLKEFPNVSASQLQFEIVETSAIKNTEYIAILMKNFNALGISFALDDFGTGFSSLSLLRALPIHTLKIDRSFILNMLHSEQDFAIIKSIIGLSKSFNCYVLAEGVETIEVAEALTDLGCDSMQGFFYSSALASDALFQMASSQVNHLN